jgi:cytoskeletal protein RodZ
MNTESQVQETEAEIALEDELEEALESEAEAEAAFRPKPDGSTDPAGEAGWFMQRERERRGISLEAAGEACGVHPHHLSAIEAGDMSKMPERADALTMIGAYAQYLGFEAEPLLEHFVEFLPKPALAPRDNHPANPGWLSSAKVIKFGWPPKLPQFSLSAIPGGAGGIIASSLAAILLFAGASMYLSPSSDGPAAEEQTAVVSEPVTAKEQDRIEVAEAPMPDASTPADSDTPADAPADAAANADPAADPETDVATTQEEPGTGLDDLTKFIQENVEGAPPAAATASTDPAPTSSQGGREFGTENAASRLVLKAKAPVWVRVEDTSGNVVMTQMLMTGDIYRVPERQDLIVIARDGGLISYEIDGKERGVLGPPGEILVGRPLNLKELDKKG